MWYSLTVWSWQSELWYVFEAACACLYRSHPIQVSSGAGSGDTPPEHSARRLDAHSALCAVSAIWFSAIDNHIRSQTRLGAVSHAHSCRNWCVSEWRSAENDSILMLCLLLAAYPWLLACSTERFTWRACVVAWIINTLAPLLCVPYSNLAYIYEYLCQCYIYSASHVNYTKAASKLS